MRVLRRENRRQAATILAAIALLVPLSLSALVATPAHAASSRPNVVIVMTDDQRWDTVTPQYMPMLSSILADNPSITFSNAFVPNSLCCPSRTSTLTGDYSHTTGVFGNVGQWGGFRSFTPPPEGRSISSINDTTTIAVDMKQAGYRTALIGKYLNGYSSRTSTYIPPGWDRWFVVPTGAYSGYWAATGYAGSSAGNRLFGSSPSDYITRVLTKKATRFVENSSSTQPFFLYYATTAPHAPAIPDPLDVKRFSLSNVAGGPYVQPPSFGNAEAGAPDYVQALSWDSTTARAINKFHVHQLDANYSVDRSIGELWDVLPSNTLVLFMSDNGYSWGEHKWSGKRLPYNEALRVPMALVGKGLTDPLPRTGTAARIVLNVDVLQTLEGLAGVSAGSRPSPPEGIDMLGALRRSDFVTEHWSEGFVNSEDTPTYCGIRSAHWMYVRYNRFEEPIKEGLYDEDADPFEMNDLAVTDPADSRVAAELQAMRAEAANVDGTGLCQEGLIYPSDWPYR
jgi:N-acetylglucosamine-6-sulfatase